MELVGHSIEDIPVPKLIRQHHVYLCPHHQLRLIAPFPFVAPQRLLFLALHDGSILIHRGDPLLRTA